MISAQAKADCAKACERVLEDFRERGAGQRLLGRAVMEAASILKWFGEARSGGFYVYHESKIPLSAVRETDPVVGCVADIAAALYDRGLVWLTQSRNPDGVTQYRVTRSSKGFVPAQAMGGTVGSSQSPAYNGRMPGVSKTGGFVSPVRAENNNGFGRGDMDVQSGRGTSGQ